TRRSAEGRNVRLTDKTASRSHAQASRLGLHRPGGPLQVVSNRRALGGGVTRQQRISRAGEGLERGGQLASSVGNEPHQNSAPVRGIRFALDEACLFEPIQDAGDSAG